jgi:hypothetical protein
VRTDRQTDMKQRIAAFFLNFAKVSKQIRNVKCWNADTNKTLNYVHQDVDFFYVSLTVHHDVNQFL